MEVFAADPDITSDDLSKINHCRKYLQVWTISDITDGSGLQVTRKAFTGQRDLSRISLDKWETVRKPAESAWAKWRRCITKSYFPNKMKDN